jgi:isopentenyl phosphate kinase
MLVFLKLGGSLITDKNKPRTPRMDVLERIAAEIVHARKDHPDLKLVLGHGSGSFGHLAAHQFNTRHGVYSHQDWIGFAEVWKQARDLNHLVVELLYKAGIPVVAIPPSATMVTNNKKVAVWALDSLQMALAAGLVPLIYGDVVFDQTIGGTIYSTEECFVRLADVLHPQSILLAGIESGVWADFPTCNQLIHTITPSNFNGFANSIRSSAAVDVTGGMLDKVQSMLELVKRLPVFQAVIFSGSEPGTVYQALGGTTPGTVIKND